jgi:hypothetical protein
MDRIPELQYNTPSIAFLCILQSSIDASWPSVVMLTMTSVYQIVRTRHISGTMERGCAAAVASTAHGLTPTRIPVTHAQSLVSCQVCL